MGLETTPLRQFDSAIVMGWWTRSPALTGSALSTLMGAAVRGRGDHTSTFYDSNFYRTLKDPSHVSATKVVPIILRLIEPKCVVDVGCGIGTWLSVFRELGVDDVLGVDGDYVNRSLLLIPPERFVSHDLSKPITFEKTFDLAVSLEVAEHLEVAHAPAFVRLLTSLAPVVLFSAAIPFQGGTHHLNEQWPEYWSKLFSSCGYVPIDCIRDSVWDDDHVAHYYAQNTIVYVDKKRLYEYPKLECFGIASGPLARVHPKRWEELAGRLNTTPHEILSLRLLLRVLPYAVWGCVQRRITRLRTHLAGVDK